LLLQQGHAQLRLVQSFHLRGRNVSHTGHWQKSSQFLIYWHLELVGLHIFLALQPFLDGGTDEWIFMIRLRSVDQIDIRSRVPMSVLKNVL
jgi:hypothetical protein